MRLWDHCSCDSSSRSVSVLRHSLTLRTEFPRSVRRVHSSFCSPMVVRKPGDFRSAPKMCRDRETVDNYSGSNPIFGTPPFQNSFGYRSRSHSRSPDSTHTGLSNAQTPILIPDHSELITPPSHGFRIPPPDHCPIGDNILISFRAIFRGRGTDRSTPALTRRAAPSCCPA